MNRWISITAAVIISVALALLLIIVRLWIAYRWYLRFGHPFWTVVLSQIVALLGALAAMSVWEEILRRLR